MISGRTILPSLLITTSRKTSNRVRSFARDLWMVLHGTERFNRGGMGLTELVARVRQSGANAALVISMWKGNPSLLTFTTSNGKEVLSIKIESGKLIREVNPSKKNRVAGIAGVFIKSDCSDETKDLGHLLASFLDVTVIESTKPEDIEVEENWSFIWLEDLPSGKILWTHYFSRNSVELGPRIRVVSYRRNE